MKPSAENFLMPLQSATLAQVPEAILRILAIVGLLLVVAVLLVLLAVWLRRRFVQSSNDQPPTGFTLHEMRQLHQEGQLTDEEYQAARAALLARSRYALADDKNQTPDKPDSSSSRPPDTPPENHPD